jgi:tetratricopeptide (TPR) repeat protein
VRSAAWLAAALGVLVYVNALGNDFAYDDMHIIVDNESIQSLATVPRAIVSSWWPDEHGEALGLWRPTSTALLGLQYAVFGDNAAPYHAVNVLAHAATSAVVVLLLSGLLALPVALLAGVMFALHPVHTEAVANVIGIAEVASTLFFLLACWVHLRCGPRSGWRPALFVAAWYALAFGAKEIAVTLPGVIFLIDAARGRLGFGELPGYLRDRWKVYAAMGVTAAAMLAARYAILGSIANPIGPLGAGLLEEGVPRIWTLGEIWSHYVRLMVFPLDLSSDYSPNVIPLGLGWHALNTTGAVMVLAILAGCLAAWRRPPLDPDRDSGRVVAFGVLWFLITISPVSNVLFLAGVLLAERTLYLPSVGAIAGLAWLLVRLYHRRRIVGVVCMIATGVFMSWRTWTRNPVWHDNLTVFGQMIEDYPHSGRSQWVLGDLFLQQGRTSEALVSYRAALGILGNHYFLTTAIARKFISLEENRAAEILLLRAADDYPEFARAQQLLAVLYSERGDALQAERYLRLALDLVPEDRVSNHLLAWALTEQGRYAEAAVARRRAIELGEGDYWQQWVSLAYLELSDGDSTAARIALDSARVKAVTEGGRTQVDSLYLDLLGFEPVSDTLSETLRDPGS